MLLKLGAGKLLAALGPRRALLALAEHALPPEEQDAVDRVAEHGDLQQATSVSINSKFKKISNFKISKFQTNFKFQIIWTPGSSGVA